MISFRFHLVSLAAVFMALALGIVLGTTVLNEATVNTLEGRIKTVRARIDETETDLSAWRKFGNDAEDALVAGRLVDVRVLLVVPESLNGSIINRVRSVLAIAGAVDAGTVIVGNAWGDVETPPTDDAADALGIVGPNSIESVTDAAAERLATEFVAGGGATLGALIAANLLRFEGGDPATAPGGAARFLVIGDGPPTGLLEPLARDLAVAAPKSVLVGDAGPDEEIQASLVGELRDDPESAEFSTVDHLDGPTGRVAAVLALRDFDRKGIGDYGSGHGADRAAPPSG